MVRWHIFLLCTHCVYEYYLYYFMFLFFVEMQVIKLWNLLRTRFYFLSGWTERRCRPITCASALQPKRALLCVCAWGGV